PVIQVASTTGSERREIPLDASAATGLSIVGGTPGRIAVLVGTDGQPDAARLLMRDLTGGDGTWREVAISGQQPVDLLPSPDGARLLVQLGERGAFARQLPGFAGASRVQAFAEVVGSALGETVSGILPTWSRD